MDTVLYLTQEEIDNIFEKLPAKIQKTWKKRLQVETIDAYETEQELTARLNKTKYDDIPGMEAFAKHAVTALSSDDVESASPAGIPEAAYPRFFYSIGACGMSAMLEIAMQDPKISNEIMETVAGMSFVRHIILEANASGKAAA